MGFCCEWWLLFNVNDDCGSMWMLLLPSFLGLKWSYKCCCYCCWDWMNWQSWPFKLWHICKIAGSIQYEIMSSDFLAPLPKSLFVFIIPIMIINVFMSTLHWKEKSVKKELVKIVSLLAVLTLSLNWITQSVFISMTLHALSVFVQPWSFSIQCTVEYFYFCFRLFISKP